jgi:hypothetical protein
VSQVRAAGLEEGEERQLRASLRQMESRRQAVERCSMVRLAVSGDGGGGGVLDGLRGVEAHLHAILMQEEAAAAGPPSFLAARGAEKCAARPVGRAAQPCCGLLRNVCGHAAKQLVLLGHATPLKLIG